MRTFAANAGHVVEDDNGNTIFVFDPAVRAQIAHCTGENIPARLSVSLFCNPTFPILAPVGGFVHPARGACWPMGIPGRWQWAWRKRCY